MAEGGQILNLSCPLCLDIFKTPKILSCGHTYCLPCVDPLVDRNRRRPSLQCPSCRKMVTLPESRKTEDLTTNFQLLSIIDQYKAERQEQNTTRNDKAADASSKCKFHQTETLLYCKTCKLPVCVHCTVGEHDVGKHDICKKGDFVKEQLRQATEMTNKLDGIKREYTKLKGSFTERKNKFNKGKHDLEKQVHDEFKERQQLLEADRDKLLEEINKSTSEKEEEIKSTSDRLDTQKNLLENMEQETGRMTAELKAQKITDEKCMNEASQQLQNISTELEKLEKVINLAPTEPDLNFKVACTKGRIGTLNKPVMKISASKAMKYTYKPKVRRDCKYIYSSEEED